MIGMGQRGAILRSLLVAAVALTAGQAICEPREIGFSDLPDPIASNFEDPFRDMGFEMLGELRTVVRLEERLSAQDVPSDVRPRLENSLLEARSTLDANGFDIEDLLAQRWTIAEKRKQALTATNPEISDNQITIAGHFIPAGLDDNGLPIGYLVAEVGMCGHTPPPPPNQLVRVQLNASLPHRSLYQPLEVTGFLRVEDSIETVFVLDGDVRMISRWMLDSLSVSLKQQDVRHSNLSPWAHRLRRSLVDSTSTSSD